MSLEDMVKFLTNSTCQMQQESQKFQQEIQASIRNLETQVSQLKFSMKNFENNKGKIPFQVILNPKENANTMTLCSGKEIQSSVSQARKLMKKK